MPTYELNTLITNREFDVEFECIIKHLREWKVKPTALALVNDKVQITVPVAAPANQLTHLNVTQVA